MVQKRSDKPHRPQIESREVNAAWGELREKIISRLTEKGWGSWVSRHEVLGFLTEEYHEAVEAVHVGTEDQFRDELLDIAVGCIFGIACIDSKGLDW